jgi:hypothetical protein
VVLLWGDVVEAVPLRIGSFSGIDAGGVNFDDKIFNEFLICFKKYRENYGR